MGSPDSSAQPSDTADMWVDVHHILDVLIHTRCSLLIWVRRPCSNGSEEQCYGVANQTRKACVIPIVGSHQRDYHRFCDEGLCDIDRTASLSSYWRQYSATGRCALMAVIHPGLASRCWRTGRSRALWLSSFIRDMTENATHS